MGTLNRILSFPNKSYLITVPFHDTKKKRVCLVTLFFVYIFYFCGPVYFSHYFQMVIQSFVFINLVSRFHDIA